MQKFACGFLVILSIIIYTGCTSSEGFETNPTQPSTSYTNLFIGTDGVGNTHPGAVLPSGMIAISPQTFDFRDSRQSTGYRQGHDLIYGFSCINMSGVGCPGAGSIPFKFASGQVETKVYGSKFSEEEATPGFYKVKLDDYNITVKATATTRSGIFQVELPAGQSQVFLDLTAQQGHIKGGEVTEFTNDMVKGYQFEGFFCGSTNKLQVYFHAELDKPADSSYLTYENQTNRFKQNVDDKPSGIIYKYFNDEPTTIHIKLGASFVSTANAKENLDAEQSGFEFDKVKSQALASWQSEFDKIQVVGGSDDEKTVFYTALYHSLLMPLTFSDVNGEYIKHGSKEVGKADYTRYTAYSLWDTYRTTHPLFTLAYPEKQLDMVKTMIDMASESGWLPKWEIFGTETNIMVGDPAAIVIADSYIKGVNQFDVERAYSALTKQADQIEGNYIRRGLKEYINLGYIAMDGEFKDVKNFEWFNGVVWGPVSTSMEFNLADYGIAQMAKKLGKEDDYKRYMDRSMSFIQLYDKETGLLRPKNTDGSWYSPFNPTQGLWEDMRFGLRGGPGFVEGSAWQYLFSIPHGIDSLKSVMGEEEFLSKLNAMFEEDHFDMTNEPDLGYPFFYNYTPLKSTETAKAVHGLLNKYFTNAEDGIPGNDDAGTMSAWVVFAMMGIYPDTPGNTQYQVTTPSFEKVTLALNPDFYKGETITIERNGPKSGAIESITLNGSEAGYQVDHVDLTSQTSTLTITTRAPEVN